MALPPSAAPLAAAFLLPLLLAWPSSPRAASVAAAAAAAAVDAVDAAAAGGAAVCGDGGEAAPTSCAAGGVGGEASFVQVSLAVNAQQLGRPQRAASPASSTDIDSRRLRRILTRVARNGTEEVALTSDPENLVMWLSESTLFLDGVRTLINGLREPPGMPPGAPRSPSSDLAPGLWLAAGCLASAGIAVFNEVLERRRRANRERIPYPPRQLSAIAWSIVISIDVLGSVSTDFFIPLVPIVVEDLGTSAFAVALSLAVNWVLKGVGDFCLGVLSERWGRVPVFMIGSVLYSTSALACSAAPSVGWLILLRAVQGFGEANSDISTAVMRDVLEDTAERVQMNSVRWCVRSVALPSALLLGGILGARVGWRKVFILMGVWGFLNHAGAALVLPETRPPTDAEEARSGSEAGLGAVACQLFAVVSGPTSCACIWLFIFLFAGVYAVLSIVPLALEDFFGIHVVVSSLLMSTIPLVGLLLPTAFLSILSHNVPPLETMKVGMSVQLLAACLACLFSAIARTPLMDPVVCTGSTLLVVWLMMSALGLCVAPLETIFLEPLGHVAGLASGLVAMTQTFLACGICLVAVAATERWQTTGMLLSLAGVMASCQLVFWCILAPKYAPPKPGSEDPQGDS